MYDLRKQTGGPLALVSSVVLTVLLATSAILGMALRTFGAAWSWSSRWLAADVVGVILLVTVLVFRRARTPATEGSSRWATLLVPLGWISAAVLTIVKLPVWYLNGDNVRHTVLTAWLVDRGKIDYAVQSYPSAWHFLVGVVWRCFGPGHDITGLETLIKVQAVATALLVGLVVLCAGDIAMRLLSGSVRTPTAAAVTAIVSGAMMLNPSVLRHVAYGFQTELAALVCLFAVGGALVARVSATAGLLLSVTAGVATAHTWQLLMAAPVAAAGYFMLQLAVSRPSATRMLACGAVCVVGLALSVPPIAAIARQSGVGHAAAGGDIDAPPYALLACGLFLACLMAWRARGASVAYVVLSILPAAEVVALWLLGLAAPTSYYSTKLLWVATVMLTPAAVAEVTFQLAQRDVLRSPLGRGLAGLLAASVLFVAFISVSSLLAGRWLAFDGDRVLQLLRAPGAERAQVVWTGGRNFEGFTVQGLLEYFHLGTSAGIPAIPSADLVADCRALSSATHPVVLSDQAPALVADHFACVPELLILGPAAR